MSIRKVGMTIDFLDDATINVFTREKIGWLLEMISKQGIERVNWHYDPPYTGLFKNAGLWPNMTETLRNVPDYLETAIKYGHELGLETFMTFKPYEEGVHLTFPPGSDQDKMYGKIDRVGGRIVWTTDWIAKHPELRVKRRMDDIPADLFDVVIDRIELDKNDNIPVGLKKDDVKVYVSHDNCRYEEYKGNWQLKEEVVPALLLDYFGNQLNIDTHETCRVTISNLSIGPKWKFFAVDAGAKSEKFRMIPMTMCRVYDTEDRQLPVTFATATDERDAITVDTGNVDFQNSGFEYDCGKAMGCSGGSLPTTFRAFKLGLARGVNKYLAGAPCEGYPEVREHWMEEIRKILALDVDGIEIRHSNHSSDTQDPYAYGFNEPVLARYRELEGTDVIAYDPVKIMRIRGEFYTRFLEEASTEIRAAGVKVQAQVISQYANGNIRGMASRAFTGVWPDWEKWVRDIVDGITFRDFLVRNYNSDFDRVIRKFARSLDKEVWMPCYFHMAGNNVNDTYLQQLEKDEEITGVMFYEAFSTYEEKKGCFEFKSEFLEPFKRFMERNR